MPQHNSGNWRVDYGPAAPADERGLRPGSSFDGDEDESTHDECGWESEPLAHVSEDPFDLDEDDPIYDADERLENLIAQHEDLDERCVDGLEEPDGDDDDGPCLDERELGDSGA